MKLYDDKDAFSELITETAQSIGLPELYVEKDYWVTKALKHLSESEHVGEVVFKGGTSLSKAYKLIHRFSEDIDLAVLAQGLGDTKRKALLKSVEQAVSSGLTTIQDDRVSKGSNYRKTIYQYPRHIDGSDFGQASSELLIEVNAFTRPEPFEPRTIRTLIADALEQLDRRDLIEQYGLGSFTVNVLSIRRTLVEKLLGIIKDSYYEDPVARLSGRIRHLYDICQILKLEEYRAFIKGDEFPLLCIACIEDEKRGFFDYADSLGKPLGEAPLFARFKEWRPALQTTYSGTFSDLVYGDVPPMDDIEETIDFLKGYV